MKKLFSIFCLLILSSFTYGDLVERDGIYYQINSEEPFTGIIESYFESIHITDNDCPEEDRVDNFLDPSKKISLDYLCREYGNSKVSPFKTKNKNQKVKILLRSGDVLQSRTEYKDGLPDGFFESYFGNGQLREKGNYIDGKIDGPFESFHGNGQLDLRSNHIDGKTEGLREIYYENGQIEYRTNFKNGT